MTNTWIVTTNAQIGNLVEAGRALGGTITVVAVGDAQIAGVDKVISITADADVPAGLMPEPWPMPWQPATRTSCWRRTVPPSACSPVRWPPG